MASDSLAIVLPINQKPTLKKNIINYSAVPL